MTWATRCPGVKVHVGSYLQGNPDAPTWWLDEDLLTDNEGKWHYDNAPAKLDRIQMYLEVTHHDYPQSQNAKPNPRRSTTQRHV